MLNEPRANVNKFEDTYHTKASVAPDYKRITVPRRPGWVNILTWVHVALHETFICMLKVTWTEVKICWRMYHKISVLHTLGEKTFWQEFFNIIHFITLAFPVYTYKVILGYKYSSQNTFMFNTAGIFINELEYLLITINYRICIKVHNVHVT